MKVHTNAKDYQCDICDKLFRGADGLKKHLVLHTTTEPFVCDECGKKFVSLYRLQTHQSTHKTVSDTIFKCDKCNESFKKYYLLKKHVKQLHMDAGRVSSSKVQCSSCLISFYKTSNLEQHKCIRKRELTDENQHDDCLPAQITERESDSQETTPSESSYEGNVDRAMSP